MSNPVHIGNIVFDIHANNELVVAVGCRRIDALSVSAGPEFTDGGKLLSNLAAAEYLGVFSWKYVDSDGKTITPTCLREHPKEFSQAIFADVYKRPPELDEDDDLQQSIAAAAQRSTIVKAWATGIDFEALHAFDGLLSGCELLEAYAWITENNDSSKAIRRFVLDFPLLAEAVCHGDGLFRLTDSAPNMDEAYRLLLEHVLTKGLSSTASGGENTIRPLPRHLLNSLHLLKLDTVQSFDAYDTMSEISIALNFACDLPENSFPTDSKSYSNFAKLAHVVSRLRGGVYDDVATSLDFTIELNNNELAQMLAPEIATRFSKCPEFDVWSATSSLIYYGLSLCGRTEEVLNHLYARDVPFTLNHVDSTPLKDAFLKNGFVRICKASETYLKAEAEFVEIAGFNGIAQTVALQ